MSEPRWLTVQQILAIHERLIFDHGGWVAYVMPDFWNRP